VENGVPVSSKALMMRSHHLIDYDYEHRPEKHWPEHEHGNAIVDGRKSDGH